MVCNLDGIREVFDGKSGKKNAVPQHVVQVRMFSLFQEIIRFCVYEIYLADRKVARTIVRRLL